MDLELFKDAGQFSKFDTHSFLVQYQDDSTSFDDLQNLTRNEMHEWDVEREINGDLALIPISSNLCNSMTLNKISESPPTKEDFHKIMTDWQQFIGVDTGCDEYLIEDPNITPVEDHDDIMDQQKTSPLNASRFDLPTYLNEHDPKPTQSKPSRIIKAGKKKIDIKEQKYIVEDDEDDVDVETFSENENSPVLEAGDLNSLLEQFEATEVPQLPCDFIESNSEVYSAKCSKNNIEQESTTLEKSNFIDQNSFIGEIKNIKTDKGETENFKIEVNAGVEHVEKLEQPIYHGTKDEVKVKQENIKEECKHDDLSHRNMVKQEESCLKEDKKSSNLMETFEPSKVLAIKNSGQCDTPNEAQIKPSKMIQSPYGNTALTLNTTKHKQIIDALPQELIARIKESGKRKTVSVIPPMSYRKRRGLRAQAVEAQLNRSKLMKAVSSELVQLDHDYCSSISPYLKQPKKDSGFESAEEDDPTLMEKQPVVKNADGKLMISLLKVNTIHVAKSSQKKKLNLEEYKKRREGFLKSQNSSQNCSPLSSRCSSPLPEDENSRLIKHQEKLMKMALEVLNSSPKTEKQSEAPLVILPPQSITIPPGIEKKTLISRGVNTDHRKMCKSLLTPVEKLVEIEPLLKKASPKINSNSLITSVLENIPKVLNKCDPQTLTLNDDMDKAEHGEDKTIIYLSKKRTETKTNSVEVQTDISLMKTIDQSRFRRRRNSSSSSCSSSYCSKKSKVTQHHSRRRKTYDYSSSTSTNSRCSRSRSSSSSCSSSSSRSSSASSSPRYYHKERERLREVEERRVIYVGRILPNTTKEDLKKRFLRFGPITSVSLHFREYGDNYGFVTFANKLDAYEAIEHGNDNPHHPKYDLSFGGRRIFCQTSYADLDNMRDESSYSSPRAVDTFDTLLRDAQEKLRKRKA